MSKRSEPEPAVKFKVEWKLHYQLKEDNYHHCKYCDKKYKLDPTGSTTLRISHLTKSHMDKLIKKETVGGVVAKKPRIVFPQIDGDVHVNRCLVRFFAEFNVPNHAVDSDSFWELMRCSGKNVKLPCRRKLSALLVPQYATQIRASNAAATSQKDVSLSFDEYSKGARRFLGVVCSYIDDFWRLNFQRVSVESFPKTTTGEEIAAAVKSNVIKMKVKSVVGTTRDGGSNVVKACKILGYGDLHCYDHVFSLVIVYGWKRSRAFNLIEKAKTLSGSFARSPTATLHLRECGAVYSMKTACCTRWNWMGRVVKCLLLNWEALEKYALHHTDGKKSAQRKLILEFDEDDLTTLKEFQKVFQFCDEQFKMAEGRTALASSILYMCWQTTEMLKKGSSNLVVDDFLKKFMDNFKPRIKKYRENEVIKIATFLDPRFCMKLQLYSKDEWEDIKKLIIDKFDVEPPKVVEINEQDRKEAEKDGEKSYGWVSFDDGPESLVTSSLKDEVERFAKEKRIAAPLPNKNTTNLALEFWKEKQTDYPILASLSKKYLSILASSAEPERCFSTVTDVFVEIDEEENEEFESIITAEEESKLIDD